MPLLIADLPVPLRTDSAGLVRVGKTRVTLNSVVTAYKNGSTAEQILDDFPTLDLADVHAVIGYYLRHVDDLERYLQEERQVADRVRQEIATIVAPTGTRQRLLARRSRQE